MEFKRILVPVDGAALSERAMSESLKLAQQLRASVVGFVAEPMAPTPSSPRNAFLLREELEQHQARTHAHADRVLARFAQAAAAAGVPFEGCHEEAPRVDQAIIDIAMAKQCDLIVMVTHGRGPFGEFLFGSHTKAVLAGSTLPLLILR